MTKDDLISMAEQAGISYLKYISEEQMELVERFAELVAAAERESCAKVCDEHLLLGNKCAAAIRARGDKHD